MDPSIGLPHVVRFGIFELDVRSGELCKPGSKLRLQDKPLQILSLLLEHPGEVVTREEIQKRLWPNGIVVDFEHSINAAVKRLRVALGDEAEHPRFIETLPRHGYRFIAPVDGEAGPLPALAPQGRASEGDGHPQGVPLRRWWIVAAAGGLVAAVVAVLVALNIAGVPERVSRAAGTVREPPLQIQSIAVLPFDNLSHDSEQEYFADGMTEELITNLGKIGALRVISRTSVMQYKGTRKPLPQIARELNVDALIEGSVLRSGERVRITANLLHAPADRHLWAATYERDVRDVLLLQDEVTGAIAREIQIKVTRQEQARLANARLANARPVNPEAHRLCLLGRFVGTEETAEGYKTARDYFQHAIEIDPGYAPAYAGVADSYMGLRSDGDMSAREAVPRGKAAAQKAVEIDPSLAEAHTSLAIAYYEYDWDWAASEKEFQRAIELNPNYATAHDWYGFFLARMRRYNEGIAENKKAQELDPFSLGVAADVAHRFYDARRYDEAISQVQKVLALFPDSAYAYWILGYSYEAKGSYEEAIPAWEKYALLSTNIPLAARLQDAAALRRDCAKAGLRCRNLWQLERLTRGSESRYAPPYAVARIYAQLGERNQAMAWLERAYQERDVHLVWLQIDRTLDSMRSDPRFQDLLRRMNFPP